MMGSTVAEVDVALFECKKYYAACPRDAFIIEMPKHKVTINDGFWMGKYELTQGQWQAMMGVNPSKFKDCGANCPVEQVSWDDIQVFLKKLNAENDGFEYSLPSEAQWEYAARAGTTGDYYENPDSIAWYMSNSGGKTHPVGQKQANAFGLYDMHGNVFELVQDIYNSSYQNLPVDGSANMSVGDSSFRVMRGGSFPASASSTRSASRFRSDPPGSGIGFRVAARPK